MGVRGKGVKVTDDHDSVHIFSSLFVNFINSDIEEKIRADQC